MRKTVVASIGGLVATAGLVPVAATAHAATSTPVTYTSNTTLTVPATACHAKFVLVGASGANGNGPGSPIGGTGGKAATVTATLSVLGGQHLALTVGKQGDSSSGAAGTGLGFSGGVGGGYSALRNVLSGTPLIVAGGGGGGGAAGPAGNGGAGGNAGAAGSNGVQLATGQGPGENASGGQPGTSHAGGAAGTEVAAPDGDANASAPGPTAGSFLTGGQGGSNGDGGGGGGAGYFGGGGGGGGYDSSGAGGGGGSSLVPSGGTVTTATTAGPGSITVTWISNCVAEKPTLKLSSPFRGYFLAKVHTHPVLRRVFVAIATIKHGHATIVGDIRTNSHGVASAMFPAKRGSKVRVQARVAATPKTYAGRSAIETVRIHR